MDMFEVPVFCLKLIGFQRHAKYSRLLQIAQMFVLTNMCFGIFSQLFSIPQTESDLMEAAKALAPEITALVTLCKGMILFCSLDEFYAFMKKINELSSGRLNGFENKDKK